MGQDFCQNCNNNNFPLSKYEGNLNYKYYYNNEIQQTNTHNLNSNRSNNSSFDKSY